MVGPGQPSTRRRRPSLLIIALIIGIVAILTVAGAYVLTNPGPTGVDNDGTNGSDHSADDDNNTGDNDAKDNTTIDPLRQLGLRVGDYAEFAGEAEMLGIRDAVTVRLTVTEVAATGYTIQMSITGAMSQEGTFHANSTEELIAGMSGGSFDQGALMGSEILPTVYGDKRVEHWSSTTSTESANNVTDYFIGNATGMVYKVIIQSTSNDLLRITTTTTVMLTDTSIDKLKTGDVA